MSTKPRHPNKRRAAEEKALEELRSEAAPLGNEEQPVIPMFPLEALYDQEPTQVRDSPATPDENPATEAERTDDEASPNASSPEPGETRRAPHHARDTGMASRAPPKPNADRFPDGREDENQTGLPSPLANRPKREVAISTRPEPRRDSKPWHDLTVPSKARQAERAVAESARSARSRPKQANPWLWIVGLLGALIAVAITALELERPE